MTWYDEIIIEHNISEAMELAQINEIPLALIDDLMGEVSDERDN